MRYRTSAHAAVSRNGRVWKLGRFASRFAGDRRHLREWAEAAKRDAENTLSDLDNYPERDWWERRSRSLLAVAEQVLEALGEDVPRSSTGAPIVTFTREQRDALLDQLDALVYQETDRSIDALAAKRELVEDALELYAALADDESEPTRFWDHAEWAEHQDRVFPIMSEVGEQPSGWDGSRRSVRLARIMRRLHEHAEDGLVADAERIDPEIQLRDNRLATLSAHADVLKAMSPSGGGD